MYIVDCCTDGMYIFIKYKCVCLLGITRVSEAKIKKFFRFVYNYMYILQSTLVFVSV